MNYYGAIVLPSNLETTMDKQQVDLLYREGKYLEMMALIRPDWAIKLDHLIPQRMHHDVVEWIFYGTTDDDFLRAVVSHELFETFKRADDGNSLIIDQYVKFFYNYSPIHCHGVNARSTWRGVLADLEPNNAA
jgi:hypothetical protein